MQVQIKHISLTYFLVLIVLKAMAAPLVVLHFQSNQAFVAKYQCINRGNPTSGCKGSCQLKKKLQNNSDTQQQQTQNTNSLTTSIDFFEVTEEPRFVLDICRASLRFTNATPYWHAGFNTDIFHPPSA
jgi:hypothetical protein